MPAHSDSFLRLSAQVMPKNAHSDSFLRLSAQVMPKNAHSDPFLRLSAQFSPQMAHSNDFQALSEPIHPKKYEPHEEVRTFHYLKFLISKSTDDRYSSAAIVFISFEP